MPRGTRYAAAAAVAVPAVVLGLALGGSSGQDRPEVSTGDRPPGQPYPNAAPSIAAQPDSALVARGAPAGTASLQDPSTGAVIWEGPLPFPTPVVYPDVAALDDGSYVVAGVPCTTVETMNDSGPDCSPGGVAVATFSPGDRRFEVLKAAGLEGLTPYVQVLGRAGDDVILQIDGSIHRLPVTGGELVPYPAAPLDGLSRACLVGDAVVVVEHRLGPGDPSPEPGELVEVPDGPFVPFAGASLDLRSARWTALGSPAATYDTSDTFELGCTSAGLLALPSERPVSDASPYVSHLLDLRSRSWADVAPPPREFLAAAPAAGAGDLLALSVSSDLGDADTAVLVFDAATNAWSARRGGDGARAMAVALAGDRLVSVADGDTRPSVVDLALPDGGTAP